MKSRKLKLMIGAVLVVAASSFAVFVVATEPDPEPGQTGETLEAFADEASSSDLERFALLEPVAQSRGVETEIPEVLQNSLNSVLVPDDQADLQVGLTTLPGGSDFVLAANTHAVCLSEDTAGFGHASCMPTQAAVTGQIVSGTACAPGLAENRVRVQGVAPDGVDEVAIDLGVNGSIDLTTPVVDNVYQVDVPERNAELSDADGVVTDFHTTQPIASWALPAGLSCSS